MTATQKTIKYLALAFAVFLIVSIFSAIIFGLKAIFNLFTKTNEPNNTNITVMENYSSYLDIDLKYANLYIKNGESLMAKTDNDKISIVQNNNKLIIKEKGKRFLSNFKQSNVTLYIPDELEFDSININSGAGKLEIDSITTNDLNINLGAGKSVINYVLANSAKIETGAGKLEINNGILNNADIEVGVGDTDITATLTGNNEIECGIGALDINLLLSENDYRINIEKGLGSIKYNDLNISNDSTIGNGINNIQVEGGIGSIKIKTNEKANF